MNIALRTVGALWKREVTKFVRDRSRLIGAMVQPLGFWLLLGLGFHGTFRMPEGAGPVDASVSYIEYLFPGIIVLMVLFTAIFSTISIINERQSGFLQAAMAAPTPRTALVLGNVLGGTSLAVAQAALFLLLAPLLGLMASPLGVLMALAACFLLGIAFTGLGFMLAWRKETVRGFHAVMNLFLLPLWFLSGAFFPAAGAPEPLRWVMMLNPVTYGVDALRQALYWPGIAPGAYVPFWFSMLVMAIFAVVMIGMAVQTVRRPLYDSK